jgi:acylphosphatase
LVRHYLIIKGEVQGVSYRKSTQRVAEELQVKGWVRNLAA